MSAPHSTGPVAGPVSSRVMDDRFCARCGANLIDQPVEREPRYGLLVARCPVCAAVAALEEHPPLARWAARWAMMVAALWVLVLVVVTAATIFLPTLITFVTVVEATDRAERDIVDTYGQWASARAPSEDVWMLRATQTEFAEFWAERGATVLEGLARTSRIEWDELAILLVPAAMALVLGCFWSLALLQRRRLVAAAFPWILLLPLLGVLAMIWWIVASGAPETAAVIVWARWRFPILMLALPVMGVCLSMGIVVGRSLARGLVRAFLPPRMRGPLAWLWSAPVRSAPAPPAQRAPLAGPVAPETPSASP